MIMIRCFLLDGLHVVCCVGFVHYLQQGLCGVVGVVTSLQPAWGTGRAAGALRVAATAGPSVVSPCLHFSVWRGFTACKALH
jgi:hypothetical protein